VLAERLLEAAGMRVVARRARFRGGEVDLVALEEDLVVFVEVKARTSVAHGRPADSVNFRKRARMARAALAYLARRDWLSRPCRFDVIEVVADGASGETRVCHIRDAFRPGLRG